MKTSISAEATRPGLWFRVTVAWLAVLLSLPMAAQVKVTGTIVDESGEPLTGALVKEAGTQNGILADVNGRYSITVKNQQSKLVFSFMGFQEQTQSVGRRTVVNVTLREGSKLLDEAVVVGYGTMRKRDVTGAVTTYRPDEMEASKVVSINDMLQGKVAGLNISSSVEQPGAASSLLIRGANSLRGDNQPLVVIDNIPQSSIGEFASSGDNNFEIASNPLSSLNPADIESIEILKDASATAIYGSRGANGVILVTTKKGKAGKANVQASVNLSVTNASHLIEMMSVNDYAIYNMIRTGGYVANGDGTFGGQTLLVDPAGDPADPANWNEYYTYHLYNGVVYRQNGEDMQEKYGLDKWSVLQAIDWQKEIYSSALTQNYGVNVSGGGEKMTYFASAGFKNIEGLVKGTGLKQGDLRLNLNARLAKRVTLDLSVNGSIKENDMMAGGNTVGGATGAISNVALTSAPYEKTQEELDRITNMYDRATVWTWVDEFDDRTKEKTFRTSLDLGVDICPWLKYDFRAGGNISIQDRDRWYGIQLYQGSIQNGYTTLTDFNRSNYSIENVLTGNKEWGDKVHLNATAGVTYDDYNSLSEVTIGSQFSDYSLRSKGLHLANNVEYKQPVQNDYQLFSVLARVNLAFVDSRYLLTASLRADGSSKFSSSNRWAYFPSATVAWRMEQEKWMKDVSWVSQMKLRAGYGMTGSQSIAAYSTVSNYATAASDGSGTVYQGAAGDGTKVVGIGITNLANNDLKWETTSSWNVGLDFSLFRDRLTGTIDVYKKTTTDLLINKQMPTSAGYKYLTVNQGDMRNRGVEISLNGVAVSKKDWEWSIGGNIAFNKSRIMDMGLPNEQRGVNDDGTPRYMKSYMGNTIGDHFGPVNLFAAGYAPGLFYGYQTDGIIQASDMDASNPNAYCNVITSSIGTIAAGNWKFVDRNGDGIIDETDKTIIGNPNPDFTYGFRTSLRYKNVTLSIQFNGVHGNDVFNANSRYFRFASNSTGMISKESYLNLWAPDNPWTGANASNTMTSGNSITPKVAFDQYVESGSYLRCSDITLNYKLPKRWCRTIGIQGLNLFASVKNAFTVSNYSGYDPEVNTFAFDGTRPGIDMSSYPHTRSFVFGLNLSL